MKRWIPSQLVDPWKLQGTISARNGNNIIFASYGRYLRQWFWVYPGGERPIPPPELLFVEDSGPHLLIRFRAAAISAIPDEKKLAVPSEKCDQLALF
jgi:hypothetical protein